MGKQKTNPSAVVWDWDGTISQGTDAVYNQANAWALTKLGLIGFEQGIPDEVAKILVGKITEYGWSYYCKNYGLTASLEEYVFARQEGLQPAAQKALGAGTLCMRPHVEDSMRAISDAGMKQAIVSNGTREETAIFMEIFDLTQAKLAELGIEKKDIFYAADVGLSLRTRL
jgi:phosphoglycolate phosphatase-like HAD superfamily hydrolase